MPFWQAAGCPASGTLVPILDPEAFHAAAACFPEVELDARVFDEYVRVRAATAGREPDASRAPGAPHGLESLFLCCACAHGDQAACRAFQHVYLPVIRRAIARIEPDRHFVDEVSAQVLDKLLVGPEPRVTRYSGRGDLGAWLKVVATRAALDAKPRRPGHDEEPLPSTAEVVVSMSPESLVLTHKHAQNITGALQRAIAGLEGKQRELLRLHYADGLNIDEIGALQGVHRATVARWLQRTRTAIESAVRAELLGNHGLGAADVTSLIQGARGLLQEALLTLLGGEASGKDCDGIDGLDLDDGVA